jgi:hypothetical protein
MSSYISYQGFIFNGTSGFPVPNVTVETQVNRIGDGGPILSFTDNITLEGKICQLVSNSGGSFSGLLGKAQHLRNIFSVDGGLLNIGCNNISIMSGTNCKIVDFSLNPTENYWTQYIDYSIKLQVERTGSCSGQGFVSSVTDSWSLEPGDQGNYFSGPVSYHTGNFDYASGIYYPIYRVTHTISAVGKYTPSGGTGCPSADMMGSSLKNAQDWVRNNFNVSFPSALSGLSLFDFSRSIESDRVNGSYSITDTFTAVPSGLSGALESFTIESSLDETYLRSVTVQGKLAGLELYNTGTINNISMNGISGSIGPSKDRTKFISSKFSGALNVYSGLKNSNAFYYRASSFMGPGFTGCRINNTQLSTNALNPIPLSITEGFDPLLGEITYSWSYNNRPLNIVPCSISENLTINDTLPSRQVAEVFVLGRRLGPVLQDLGTYSSASRSVTFEVVMPRASGISGLKFPANVYNSITGIIDLFDPQYIATSNVLATNPQTANSVKSFVRENSENWDPLNGRFSKTKSWIYTKCMGTIESLANPNVS